MKELSPNPDAAPAAAFGVPKAEGVDPNAPAIWGVVVAEPKEDAPNELPLAAVLPVANEEPVI